MSENEGRGALSVLLVEDNDGIGRMLRLSLMAAGFDVTRVASGAEALRELRLGNIDGVVLDLGLTDGLGDAVVASLQNGHKHPRPVWIAISGEDLEDVTRRLGAMGEHFMAKPFNPWDLIARLERLLAQEAECPTAA